MSKASLELGGGNWGTKNGNLLGYAKGSEAGRFVPREFSFTRGSDISATRINSSGLIEKYRENLLLQSNQFDTTWATSGSPSLSSGQSGYDGSTDAWLYTNSGSEYIYQDETTNVATYSIFAKKGNGGIGDFVLLFTDGVGGRYFDLDNGILGSEVLTGLIDSKIELVSGTTDWYRCSITFASSTRVRVYASLADNNLTSAATIYIQDAQLEQGLVATSYLESGATTATSGVADNEPRIDYAGGTASLLLEPQRTNNWIHSEYLDYSFSQIVTTTITQNTTETLSPEGLYNATKLEGIGSWIFKDFLAGTDTGTWTVSCWVKAVNPSSNNTFRLSVSGNNFSSNLTATNDWQRFYFSVTNGGATAAGLQRDTSANDADLYIYGLQVEESSYPTSYIPTYGTSVPRVADSFQNSTNDKPLGAIGQGTWFVELQKLGDDTNQALYLAPTTSNTQQIRLHFDATNARFRDARNGYSTIGGGVNVKTSMTKMALSIDTTSGIAKVYANGSQLGSDYTLQANTFEFSRIVAEGKGFILKQSLFFPNALSDAECITITS